MTIALSWQICEDIPEELDVDVPGLSERPINIFMPRLLQVILAGLYEMVCRCLLVTMTRATIGKLFNSCLWYSFSSLHMLY